MKQKIFFVDAFAEKLFEGNQAAVCIIDEWFEEQLMQNIAAENNYSETAFVKIEEGKFSIRWFTPLSEVDLCGHATLASAYIIFRENLTNENIIEFDSNSGTLTVERKNKLLVLNFPAYKYEEVEKSDVILESFSIKPQKIFRSHDDFLFVYESQNEIENIKPNLAKIKLLGKRGVVVTAPGNEVDFVSRFFAPSFGVDEDPVTGSAHSFLTPYWAEQFGKNKLIAKQLSKRGGALQCELLGNRVKISGSAVLYLEGEINV